MTRHIAIALLGGLLAAETAEAGRRHLLPTHQRVNSYGKHVELGLFPTGIALSGDGRLALITNNGFLYQSLTVVDTENLKTVTRQIGALGANVLFIGVALAPDGRSGYASGRSDSGRDLVYTVRLGPGPELFLGRCAGGPRDGEGCNGNSQCAPGGTCRNAPILFPPGSFPAGMAMAPDGQRLYVAENLGNKLAVVDTATERIVAEVPLGRQPWGVAVHPSLPQVYVSNRVDRTLSIVDTGTLSVLATIGTGNGPNAVAVSPDGAKVFVANANSDDLTVFDVNHPESVRSISLRPFDGAQFGSSPNALAFSPDGSRLYVANAWDNTVVVLSPGDEAIVGAIPTGWYPTAIAVSPDNSRLFIANMKGARTYPRTRLRQALDFRVNMTAGGGYGVAGTLQVLRPPNERLLGFMGNRVRLNNGFDRGIRPSNRRAPAGPCYPIPCSTADTSPIKHVVFIVRENKTYDQVLSDLPQGDGAPSLLMYGRQITPNLHALVEEFVLMDRFFALTEKSEPGHQWTAGCFDSDYIEKTWTSTAFNGRPDDMGVHADEGYVLPVAAAPGGYWFDNCQAHGVSFRIYGEFLLADETGTPIDYWVANTAHQYPRFNLDIPDVHRYELWKAEFDEQVRSGTFPQFTYLTLPNDHTKGTGSGVNDPRSFVADNDLATGLVVEAISHSPYWPETAIFIVEDDPQSGADHIDSHRTVAAVISPWVRRRAVTSTRYDMAGMHRTMELILGLPPMNQFDQLAIPMREIFTDEPDFTPYTARPRGFPVQLVPAGAPGAALSATQDWSRPDGVPDELLNEILWEYLRGRTTHTLR